MAHIHKITAVQAQRELTEAVKASQGSKKTASWKAAARPCWWIEDHVVTLHDNSQVRTGIFDGTERRRWKKSHFQAALFLYEQWRTGRDGKQEGKEEPKLEQEIAGEPSSTLTRKKRGKKEESVPEPSVPQRKTKKGKEKQQVVGENTDIIQPEARENSQEEQEPEKPPRTRGRRIPRSKKEMVTPPKASPIATRRTSSMRASSSSEQSDGSPSPIIRRTRARNCGKEVTASLNTHLPMREPPSKKAQRRTGKAIIRQAPKTQKRRESIPRSPESNLTLPPSRRPSGTSSHEEDGVSPAHLCREETHVRNRKSQRLSAISSGNSPSSSSPKTRKRSLSDVEDQSTTRLLRKPLQERQDTLNVPDSRSRKKRRVPGSEGTLSDKENRTPPADKFKSGRLRSTLGRKDKTSTREVDAVETAANNDNGSQEQDAIYDSARHDRKEKRIKFLREQVRRAKAERDHALKRIEDNFAEFETESNIQKRQLVEKLRAAYRTRKLKFSRQILDMPIAKFAEEHGGSVDEWMLHDTEDGVNKTFEALNRGEAPKDRVMGPPRTPTAMSRRAALATTARKTRRKVAEDASTTGFTIRRSQRTAAKVATERTRAIVSCTPRTARKEAPAPQNLQPPQTPAGEPGQAVPLPNFANICTRQQFATLAQSIRKQENPVEAFREFTAQLQKEALQ